jgi:hypothetical protein
MLDREQGTGNGGGQGQGWGAAEVDHWYYCVYSTYSVQANQALGDFGRLGMRMVLGRQVLGCKGQHPLGAPRGRKKTWQTILPYTTKFQCGAVSWFSSPRDPVYQLKGG